MPSDISYKLLWSKEVQEGLQNGTMHIVKDKLTGAPLAMAKGNKHFTAMARLLPVQQMPVGTSILPNNPLMSVLNPILGIGNLLATGFNIWQTRKVEKKVEAGFEQTQKMMTILGEGLLMEHRFTQQLISEEHNATRDLMTVYHNELQETVTAGFGGVHQQLTENHQAIQQQLSNHMALTMIGIQLSQEISQDISVGFANIEEQLKELKEGQLWIVDSISTKIQELSSELQNRKFNDCINKIHRINIKLHELLEDGNFGKPNHTLERLSHDLEFSIIPEMQSLLGEVKIGTTKHFSYVLAIAEAFHLLALALYLQNDQKNAHRRYKDAFELLQNIIKQTLLEESTPHNFYTNRLLQVKILVPFMDSFRMGMICTEEESSITNPQEPLLIEKVSWLEEEYLQRFQTPYKYELLPKIPEEADEEYIPFTNWHTTISGSDSNKDYQQRIYRQELELGREYKLQFTQRADMLGLPQELINSNINQEIANNIQRITDIWLDPANKAAIASLLLESLSIPNEDSDKTLFQDACKQLNNKTGLTLNQAALSNFSRKDIHLLAQQWRTRWCGNEQHLGLLKELQTEEEQQIISLTQKNQELTNLIGKLEESKGELEEQIEQKEKSIQTLAAGVEAYISSENQLNNQIQSLEETNAKQMRMGTELVRFLSQARVPSFYTNQPPPPMPKNFVFIEFNDFEPPILRSKNNKRNTSPDALNLNSAQEIFPIDEEDDT